MPKVRQLVFGSLEEEQTQLLISSKGSKIAGVENKCKYPGNASDENPRDRRVGPR
jgi:hypothetical protein